MRPDVYNPEYDISIGKSDPSIEFLPYEMSWCEHRIILDLIEKTQVSFNLNNE